MSTDDVWLKIAKKIIAGSELGRVIKWAGSRLTPTIAIAACKTDNGKLILAETIFSDEFFHVVPIIYGLFYKTKIFPTPRPAIHINLIESD